MIKQKSSVLKTIYTKRTRKLCSSKTISPNSVSSSAHRVSKHNTLRLKQKTK